MRIEGQTRLAAARKGGAGRLAGEGRFALPELVSGARLGNVAPAAPAGSIATLLALQSVEDPLLSRRKTIRQGRSVLDLLDLLKADLLSGQIPPDRLDRLVELVSGLRERSHPGLDAVIDEIDQRARVELAKLGRFPP